MENTIENGNVTAPNNVPVMPEKKMKRTRQRLIFYILIMIFPLLHFSIFKIYINLDMIAMAFSEYVKPDGVVLVRQFAGFKNFASIFELFGSSTRTGLAYSRLLGNSMMFYGIGLTFIPIGIFFAYYIYKGYPLANTFRVFLYLPQILSAVVLTFLYKEIMTRVIEVEGGLQLQHIVLYNFFTGFGVNVIMYTGAMCGINTSISESAQLDGASSMRELWSITVPMVFPTIVTFLVMGIAGIFTNQANLFSFYNTQISVMQGPVDSQPLGYYMYVNTLASGLVKPDAPDMNINYDAISYTQLSALGLMITVVVLPISLIIRHVLEKYGPSDR